MKILHASVPPPDFENTFKSQWKSSTITLFEETIDFMSHSILIATNPEPIGSLSYRIHSSTIEILALLSSQPGEEISIELLHELELLGKAKKLRDIRITITNANLKDLQFYQQQGFSLFQLRPRSIMTSCGEYPKRPQILDGIPIQDELVLKKELNHAMDDLFLDEVFHVKHLELRPLTEFDSNELISLFSDPKVLRYQAMNPILTQDDAKEYYNHLVCQSLQHKRLARGIFVEGQFAGIISLHQIHHDQCSLGYSLIPSYWKQGIATEAAKMMIHIAFHTLHLRRIESITHPDNIASIRVLERLRFHPEGTLIEYIRNPRTGCYENRESHALLYKNSQ